MNKMKVYLDIDGVLLTAKQTKPPENVTEFIDYVLNNFDCYWLTTHCKGDTKPTIQYLERFFDDNTIEKLKQIKPTNWITLKTEVFDFSSRFIWLEDNPLDAEKNILSEKGCLENLIVVDLNQDNELERVIDALKIKVRVNNMTLERAKERIQKFVMDIKNIKTTVDTHDDLKESEMYESEIQSIIFQYCIENNYDIGGFPFVQFENMENEVPGYDDDYLTYERKSYYIYLLALEKEDVFELCSIHINEFHEEHGLTARAVLESCISFLEQEGITFELTEEEINSINRAPREIHRLPLP